MTILNSITLSNVRRFATNQTIEFGKGATILLAPNGTGKTTIFEAIELALTGGVNRLKNTLLPLVRDTATSATAILTFDDWVRSVSLDSKGNVKINEKGQLLRIFKDAAPSDWAHLLRLTHLLDQRDRDWFVQQGNSEAGQQLDRLPMGKDAAKVSAVLTSAKIGMTKEADAAKIKLEAAQKVLKEWQRLLVERDMAYKDGVQALIPLVDIAAHLGQLSPDTVTANVATPEALQSLRADLAITNGQKLKGYELKIAEFLAENNYGKRN